MCAKQRIYTERNERSLEARVYDTDNRPLFEGKASYLKDEEKVLISADEFYVLAETEYLVTYADNLGVFYLRCAYEGFEMDGAVFVFTMRVVDTVNIVQRRQDLKIKTNIPIKITLLDIGGKIKIDPTTMKALQIPAMLRDISAGGIMVDTEYHMDVNQTIMFPFDKGSYPIMINAQVIREQSHDERIYRYGCRFLNNNSGKESVIREYVFRLESASRYSTRGDRD